MNIGYIHLDYGEWTNGSYNSQEIGLAKALEQMGHQTTIVYWVSTKDKRCNTEIDITLKSASNLNGNLNCSKELEHYAS